MANYLVNSDLEKLHNTLLSKELINRYTLDLFFNHGLIEEIISLSKITKKRKLFNDFFVDNCIYLIPSLNKKIP